MTEEWLNSAFDRPCAERCWAAARLGRVRARRVLNQFDDETRRLADELVARTEPWADLADCVRVVLSIEALRESLVLADIARDHGKRTWALEKAFSASRRFVASPVIPWRELAEQLDQESSRAR